MLLRRDGKNSSTKGAFQVLMAERSSQLVFSGMHVFPGGIIEKSDGELGERETAKKAGLRELFEETGMFS